jgi:hypothetical protein
MVDLQKLQRQDVSWVQLPQHTVPSQFLGRHYEFRRGQVASSVDEWKLLRKGYPPPNYSLETIIGTDMAFTYKNVHKFYVKILNNSMGLSTTREPIGCVPTWYFLSI